MLSQNHAECAWFSRVIAFRTGYYIVLGTWGRKGLHILAYDFLKLLEVLVNRIYLRCKDEDRDDGVANSASSDCDDGGGGSDVWRCR